MSLAKRLFPRTKDGVRRRHFKHLQLAILLGLIFAALFAGMLYLLYVRDKP